MKAWGTDVTALACVLGGAVVSGVVTVAALERRADPEPTVCVVTVELGAARARSDVARALLEEAWSREIQILQEREALRMERELSRLREELAR